MGDDDITRKAKTPLEGRPFFSIETGGGDGVKSGWRSSEGLLTALITVAAVAVLLTSGPADWPQALVVCVALAASAFVLVSYTQARARVKLGGEGESAEERQRRHKTELERQERARADAQERWRAQKAEEAVQARRRATGGSSGGGPASGS